MKSITPLVVLGLLVSFTTPVLTQNHHSNWLHRNMTDTTIVVCWNDSMTTLSCPPGGMGMMMPESMYCRINFMPMDSLHHPHDSTMIGWCRIMMGTDSIHFNLMNCDSIMGNHQMQFMRNLGYALHWDSLRCDSRYRHWHPTGVRGWDGTNWMEVNGVMFNGNMAIFGTTQLYSAYSFIGASSPTAVEESGNSPATYSLEQNYPNPFNPSTTMSFYVPVSSRISLRIYNLLGQEVASLVEGESPAGRYNIVWNGKDDASHPVASGIYLYKVLATPVTGGQEVMQVRKMILMK